MVVETAKVTVKEVIYEKVRNGAVVVYKIEDYNKLPFGDFYITTFDDTASESVWGAVLLQKLHCQVRPWSGIKNLVALTRLEKF